MRARVIIASLVSAGCPAADPDEQQTSSVSGISSDSTPETEGENTSGETSTSGHHASEGSSETGFKFDVADDGSSGSGGDPLVGSCRESEIYGAAGGPPAYTDPAYAAFGETVLFMTSHAELSTSIPVLTALDISGAPPPPDANYNAPRYSHPTWTASTFGGGIFGLTFDSDGNIYVAPSSIYNGGQTTPGTIYKIDRVTAAVSEFVTLPNSGPAFGNINYDCVSQTLRVSNHEDCRIYQIEMNGDIRSTYRHSDGDVTMGMPADPGEPDGAFCPLGQRVWAVQSHYGKIYYGVWWEDSGRTDAAHDNEIWTVEYDDPLGIPDGTTKKLEVTIPPLTGNTYSNPVSDLSFAASGWMLVAERSMYGDTFTSAHSSTTYEVQQTAGVWSVVGETYIVGTLPNSSAGGVDHDFTEGGYVWMTGDALHLASNDYIYGVQGTPYGGGTVANSTLVDHDGDLSSTAMKTHLGDCEIPIPGNVMPVPPPPG